MNLYCPILPLSRNDQIRSLGFLFGPGGTAVTVSDGVSSSFSLVSNLQVRPRIDRSAHKS